MDRTTSHSTELMDNGLSKTRITKVLEGGRYVSVTLVGGDSWYIQSIEIAGLPMKENPDDGSYATSEKAEAAAFVIAHGILESQSQ
ncbi:hypothetical protein [Variovorax sp. PAMC26660]|uniref:hypothetical protein n=1 Tax=Variovorax sp. PAMC26660 TaxID=2762322 RepID=UPI00164CF180|nr:hypothetical protein [Variovorax sp. PAMC26660]QNK65798.1 hypothetical protein H7F35_21610 [Variovorax sp. PAMC26660]